jgi:hypothetical protein
MTHTGYFCRKKYSPRRFLVWLAAWNVAAALGVLTVTFVVFVVMGFIGPGHQMSVGDLLKPVIIIAVGSAALAGILYLLNLPFLILAFKDPFYGDRFERMFHLKKAE